MIGMREGERQLEKERDEERERARKTNREREKMNTFGGGLLSERMGGERSVGGGRGSAPTPVCGSCASVALTRASRRALPHLSLSAPL